MLITFKSQGAGDVMMFGDVASQLLTVMGKDQSATRGIVTVEQLPTAIEKLRAAATTDKAQPAADSGNDDAPRGADVKVSFAQRAVPLIDLLNVAQRNGEPVTWEGK